MSESKKTKSPTDRIYDFLSSVTLSIIVLIGLAGTSIIGTILPQGEDAAFYAEKYSNWGGLIQVLKLSDMYHSWWFQVLLALLLVNITFCSLKRLPHAIKQMQDRDPQFDNRPLALHEKRELKVKGTPAAAADAVSAMLGRKAGTVVRAEKDGTVYLLASKGGWSRMGVYITHTSLFLFALGALVGTIWGFKGAVNIIEGRTVNEVYDRSKGGMTPIDFEVRCDEFRVEYYPGGMKPKDYISQLTVLKNGQEVMRKTIEVNDPLIYEGFYFYQSNYQQIGVKSAKVSVAGPDRRILATSVPLASEGRGLKLPDGSELIITDLWQDKQERGGPSGVILSTVKDGMVLQRGVVFPQELGQSWWPVGSYQVRLDDVQWLYFTGLQVAKDPGVPIVWAGCILITIGLMISFFASHRRVWARISAKGAGTEIALAGNASRNRIAFERWFEEFEKEVRGGFEN